MQILDKIYQINDISTLEIFVTKFIESNFNVKAQKANLPGVFIMEY